MRQDMEIRIIRYHESIKRELKDKEKELLTSASRLDLHIIKQLNLNMYQFVSAASLIFIKL